MSTIRSETETPGAFRQRVRIDAHTLHADVDEKTGGAASAPDAHDYFDASLAMCKALTACVVAKSRGYALDRVAVEVTRDARDERKGIYVLDVKIELEGAMSEEERHKLHDVLTKCPIHKLMETSTIEIRTAAYDRAAAIQDGGAP